MRYGGYDADDALFRDVSRGAREVLNSPDFYGMWHKVQADGSKRYGYVGYGESDDNLTEYELLQTLERIARETGTTNPYDEEDHVYDLLSPKAQRDYSHAELIEMREYKGPDGDLLYYCEDAYGEEVWDSLSLQELEQLISSRCAAWRAEFEGI